MEDNVRVIGILQIKYQLSETSRINPFQDQETRKSLKNFLTGINHDLLSLKREEMIILVRETLLETVIEERKFSVIRRYLNNLIVVMEMKCKEFSHINSYAYIRGESSEVNCNSCDDGIELGDEEENLCEICDEIFCSDCFNIGSSMCDDCHCDNHFSCAECGTEESNDEINTCSGECGSELCSDCIIHDSVSRNHYCNSCMDIVLENRGECDECGDTVELDNCSICDRCSDTLCNDCGTSRDGEIYCDSCYEELEPEQEE